MPVADEDGWHGAGFESKAGGHAGQERLIGGHVPDFEVADGDAWIALGEPGQERLGRRAVRAAIAPEEVDGDSRCWRSGRTSLGGPERRRQRRGEGEQKRAGEQSALEKGFHGRSIPIQP